MIDFRPFVASGCGNTFLVVSQAFCDRQTSAYVRVLWERTGVDSVLILAPTQRGDVKMLVPGADGVWGRESGEFCGNGSRVVARFFHQIHGRSPVIVSRDGSVFPSYVNGSVSVQFPPPVVYGNVFLAGGEPHALVPADVTGSDLIRFCNDRPRRVSANQVRIENENLIHVRTFEHSINRWTGCCGTGAISMTHYVHRQGLVGDRVKVMASGGVLRMDMERGAITMSGEARLEGAYTSRKAKVMPSSQIPGQLCVQAIQTIVPGEVIFIHTAPVQSEQTWLTVQVGPGQHMDVGEFGRHTNHSCDPSSCFSSYISGDGMVTMTCRARRQILPGEEVTFDYASTESEVTTELQQIRCSCGSQACRGNIRGYNQLTPSQRAKLRSQGLVARHLF